MQTATCLIVPCSLSRVGMRMGHTAKSALSRAYRPILCGAPPHAPRGPIGGRSLHVSTNHRCDSPVDKSLVNPENRNPLQRCDDRGIQKNPSTLGQSVCRSIAIVLACFGCVFWLRLLVVFSHVVLGTSDHGRSMSRQTLASIGSLQVSVPSTAQGKLVQSEFALVLCSGN
jgi:hypothetical protein